MRAAIDGLAAIALVACATRAAAPLPIENTATAPPAPERAPIPVHEIARPGVPPAAQVDAVVVGRWIGRRYDYNADFSGEPGDAPIEELVLYAGGRYVLNAGCAITGRYRTTWEDASLVIYRARELRCGTPDPYEFPSYIHRLDEEYLVLLDGMTGGVSAYRRNR